jgi:hypothetical protein
MDRVGSVGNKSFPWSPSRSACETEPESWACRTLRSAGELGSPSAAMATMRGGPESPTWRLCCGFARSSTQRQTIFSSLSRRSPRPNATGGCHGSRPQRGTYQAMTCGSRPPKWRRCAPTEPAPLRDSVAPFSERRSPHSGHLPVTRARKVNRGLCRLRALAAPAL